jgi:hypothetical protein
MNKPVHTILKIMAHPHNLPSFPAREEGSFFMNTNRTGQVVIEGGTTQYQLSRNEHGLVGRNTGILDKDHCFISLSLQGGDNV